MKNTFLNLENSVGTGGEVHGYARGCSLGRAITYFRLSGLPQLVHKRTDRACCIYVIGECPFFEKFLIAL